MQRWGEEKLLNSKAEFNRSKISRLTLGEEEKRIMRPGAPPALGEEEPQGESGEVQDWVEDRAKNRREQEIRSITSWERGLFRSPSRKRLGEEKSPGPASPAKKTKNKYPPLALDWGVEESPCPPATPLSPPDSAQVELKSVGEEIQPRSAPLTITNQPMTEVIPPPPTSLTPPHQPPPLTITQPPHTLSTKTSPARITLNPPPTPTTTPAHTPPDHHTPSLSKDDLSGKKEDDTMVEGGCKLVVKNLEHQDIDTEDGHPDGTPIPPHEMRGGHQTQPCNVRLVKVSTCGDTKAVSGRTRAVSYADVKDCDSTKQDDACGNSLLNFITVNGVKLGMKEMVGKDDKTKKVQNENGNSLLNFITVNGVKLGMKQMVGKDDKTKKVQNENKNKKNKENKNKNTMPSINGIKNVIKASD